MEDPKRAPGKRRSARGRPADHAGHDHRGGAAGGRAAEPAAGAGRGRRPARRRLAGRLHRAVRDAGAGAGRSCRRCWAGSIRRRSWRRPSWSWATGRPRGRRSRCASPPLMARRRLAEAFGAASLDAFGRFSDAEAVAAGAGARLRARDAGGRAAAPVAPGAAGAGRRAGDGRGDARQPGNHCAPATAARRTRCWRAVQRTLTAAGARLLAAWLAAPLTDPAAIAARQDAWSWLLANADAAGRLRALPARRAGHGAGVGRGCRSDRGGPRDLAALRDGLAAARTAPRGAGRPAAGCCSAEARDALAVDPALAKLLAEALADPAPTRLDDGGAIRPGFDAELDAERGLRDDSRRVIAGLQLDYAQRYGVASLKIRHHAQLGYVIEAPAAAVEKLREFPELTLRQGMANGARFTHAGTVRTRPAHRRGRRARGGARTRGVRASGAQIARPCRRAGAPAPTRWRCWMSAQSAARLAENGTLVPPGGDRRGGIPDRPAGRHPVVEAALAGTRRLRAERLRPVAGAAGAAADRAEHGGQIDLSAPERLDRDPRPGRPAGAGGRRRGSAWWTGCSPASAPPTTWRAGAAPSWWR